MSDTPASPGASKLSAWMDGPPKRTQAQLVKQLAERGIKTTQQSVSRWQGGTDAPDADKFPALTEITGIQLWEFWEPERAEAMRVAVERSIVPPAEDVPPETTPSA